jgi:uncharacterized membrane protein YfcA
MSAVMWKQYKKTAPFMQVGIVAVTLFAYFMTGKQLLPALVFFAVMELGALLGAAWGQSMTSRKERANAKRSGQLPLEKGR